MQSLKGFVGYAKSALTAAEMRAVEENSASLGIGADALMENAGKAVADFIRKKFPKERRLLFVCGPGNNGGDGFSAAKRLADRYDITVLLTQGDKIKKGPALKNFKEAERTGISITEDMGLSLSKRPLVITAIYGTGFHGSPPKPIARLMRRINSSGCTIIAIDIPSGVDATTGEAKSAIMADYTLTMHKPKTGLLKSKYAGKVIAMDIGIPVEAELLTGPGDVHIAYEPLPERANKYTKGSVLVIGGSPEYIGAPLLAAHSALRTSSGYLTLAVPSEIAPSLSAANPVFVYKVLEGNYQKDKNAIASTRFDAAVVGPGMVAGNRNCTEKLFRWFVNYTKRLKIPTVVDAGALRLIDGARLSESFVLTPHEGEFKMMAGMDLKEKGLNERVKAAVAFARKHRCVLVLKGHETIITDGKRLKINMAKSPALATMGTGDVLDGIVASLAARHKDAFESAAAGVYLHSLIGDTLYRRKGAHITAQDVIDGIPNALKSFDVTR